MAQTPSASANSVLLEDNKKNANLKTLFSKMKNVYYNSDPVTKTAFASGVVCELELPVLDGGVTLNTGTPDKTEIKLTTGEIWVSRAEKGDSDISFQVASIDGAINDLFLTKQTSASISGVSLMNLGTFAGESYALDQKKATGSLILTDDDGVTAIVLPNVEMYGGLVVGDGDNPAYFDVTVTPLANADGASIIILHKTGA